MSVKSEFDIRVIDINKVEKHPNADNLEIILVNGGYPVVVRKNEFKPGDKAIYIPIDSYVPVNHEAFKFLDRGNERERIKAVKLRGVFSMGLLIPNKWDINDLNIIRWEPKTKINTNGDTDIDYGIIPFYDVESLRKYPNAIASNETVVLTEKIHGANVGYIFSRRFNKFIVKSHRKYIKESDCIWWKVAKQYDIESLCRKYPDVIFYGEIYGNVQNLSYGTQLDLMLFDAYAYSNNSFFNYDEFLGMVDGRPVTPELYRGKWLGFEKMSEYAEGLSTVPGANHVREGFVVKPVIELLNENYERVQYKLHGQGYLLKQARKK